MVGGRRQLVIEYGGRKHRVEVPLGRSVMRGAVDNSISGIDADYGGECACATCHVYIDESWLNATGTPVPGLYLVTAQYGPYRLSKQ